MPGADEGDVAGGVPGGEPAGLRAAAGHRPDLPRRRRHPRPRLPAPPAPPAPRHRRDHRELLSLPPSSSIVDRMLHYFSVPPIQFPRRRRRR